MASTTNATQPVALAGRLDAEHVGRVQHQGLQQRHEQCDGHEYDADSDEEGEPGQVHACGGGQDLTPGAPVRHAERSRRAPGDAGEQDDREQDEPGEQQAELERVVDQPHQRSRTPADCAAEETGGARPEHAPAGNGVAAGAPAVRPLDRRRPLGLQVRPRRPVEEGRAQLAPAALERDPRERLPRLGRVARDRPHDRPDVEGRPARVVAADALLGRAPEVERLVEEVRVRAGGRMHDGMRAVDALELVVVPRRPLGALVLAVADLDGRPVQRLRRARGVEDQLDHLPVALVQVVPVVEDVEQPVLERELAGVSGIGRDVRVDGRRVSHRQPPLPVEVVAARVERVPREVEVVLVEAPREIRRRSGRS